MMAPWVILAIILAIGLAVSVIYTAVEFFISNQALNGTVWLIFGLLGCGKFLTQTTKFKIKKYLDGTN